MKLDLLWGIISHETAGGFLGGGAAWGKISSDEGFIRDSQQCSKNPSRYLEGH
jgi:hypothetical protein